MKDLESDKQRLMNTLRREASHIYRRFETDVFIDLMVRRKKISLNVMNGIKSVFKIFQANMRDMYVQTDTRDIKNRVRVIKVDGFGREVILNAPKYKHSTMQTDAIEFATKSPKEPEKSVVNDYSVQNSKVEDQSSHMSKQKSKDSMKTE